MPCNEVVLAAGVPDTPRQAASYLAAVVGPEVPAARQQAFLDHGPAMISFVMDHSPLRFRWMEGYSDYYPSCPAACRTAARSSRTSSTATSSARNWPG